MNVGSVVTDLRDPQLGERRVPVMSFSTVSGDLSLKQSDSGARAAYLINEAHLAPLDRDSASPLGLSRDRKALFLPRVGGSLSRAPLGGRKVFTST